MIVDAFPFLDEVDLAELRIHYLSPSVDLFIVSEFDVGFSGREKEFKFNKVLAKLPQRLLNKIVYIQQKQDKLFESPFENDRFQKDSIATIVRDYCRPNDLLIFGDLDEFPNHEKLLQIHSDLTYTSFYHFAQTNFLGFLNVIEDSHLIHSHAGDFPFVFRRRWLGTIATAVKSLEKFSITDLREPQRKSNSIRISNGGWHFSYCGGEGTSFQQRFEEKMKFTSHQELNKPRYVDNAFYGLNKGLDPFDRFFIKRYGPFKTLKRPRYRILESLNHLPAELRQKCKYDHLIAPIVCKF